MVKENLILIGMPGSGKSTLGPRLAAALAFDFVDTDRLIEIMERRTLQEILETEGPEALREIEAAFLLSLNLCRHVIATGGSAVYNTSAMAHLKQIGFIVFLNVPVEILRERLHNFEQRGIIRAPGQSLEDLFQERYFLYRTYADMVVNNAFLSTDEACREILGSLKNTGWIPSLCEGYK